MNNERILSYKQARVLSPEQIQEISAGAGLSWGGCFQPTSPIGTDFVCDLTVDGK